MKTKHSKSIFSTALMFCCSATGIVVARAEIDDYFSLSPAELAAMPVTIATGTPKPVFQSAAVTSMITAEQIKAMGATELHEVLETVPGVHASLQDSSNDYNYSFRGIRNTANSQVLMLLNGTRITTPFRGTLTTGVELPLEAIARIEVIRGPGSALYGADAFAGVINIITKTASDINGSKVGARGGNWGTHSEWGQQSLQWAGWDISASVQHQATDGDDGRILHADAQTGFDKILGTQASLAPGALNFQYETLNGHFDLKRKYWDMHLWAFGAESGSRAGTAGALDPNGNADTEQFLGDVRFSSEDWFEDIELTAHASYLYTDFLADLNLYPNNTLLRIGTDGNIKSPLSANPLVSFPDGVKANVGRVERVPSIELGLLYKAFNQHLLKFSSSFRYEEITTSERKNFGTGVIDGSEGVVNGELTDVTHTQYIYLPYSHRTIWSLVAQDEWSIAKGWQLTTGVRYDDYSDFGGTVNPRVALVWDISSSLTSKLLYGRAFRAPSFSEQFNQNNPSLLGNKNLSPETINTVEWAMDYRPMPSLRTALNVYYYEINNLISAVADSNGITSTFQNNGSQSGHGTEFEWDWQLNDGWSLRGNYAWQDAVNSDTELPITGVPEHHVYVASAWNFLPQWQIQPQLNWVGSRSRVASDQRPLPDYTTVDLTLRGKKLFNHLNLSASLRNAFNVRGLEPAATRYPENLLLTGRSFYFEASVDF